MEFLFQGSLGLLAGLSGGALAAAPEPAGLYPMVPMFHRWDYPKVAERLARVAESGAGRVSFTVLLLAELDPAFRVKSYGAVWPRDSAGDGAEPVYQALSPAMRQSIRFSLTSGFAEAVKHRLGIAVLPMIDAAGPIREWRNYFDFDPSERLGNFSYEEALLNTVREALECSVPADWPVEMTLEGELGRSLFAHPAAWRGIMERLRARGKLKRLRLGISANYEEVAGLEKPDQATQEDLRRLVAACDFIGLSCYAKVSLPPVVADFTACVDSFCAEWAAAGCPLPESKPLRFTELGHGGGGFDADWRLAVPGPLMERMGKAAFFGTDDAAKDPWTDPQRAAFRRDFHQAALDFLSMQPARWRVESAYLWSFGSFDVLGTTAVDFRDPMTAEAVRRHNAAIAAERPGP